MESKSKDPMNIHDIIDGFFLFDDNKSQQSKYPCNYLSDNIIQPDIHRVSQSSDDDNPVEFGTECPEFNTIQEEPQNVSQVSLLENENYMKLAEQCCEIYDDIEKIYQRTTNPEVKSFLDLEKSRIREALLLSGASMINDDQKFDFVKHTAVFSKTLSNGRTIDSIIEPGIMIADRVMIKAKLKLIEFGEEQEHHIE